MSGTAESLARRPPALGMEAPAQRESSLEEVPRVQERPPARAWMQEERAERLVELPASFREILAFFCANATIHGATRLACGGQSRLQTASWGLLLLGALGGLCWQGGLLLEQYWRYPVSTAVSLHSGRRLVPSVTLCDMNPQRPAPARGYLQKLDELARENIYALYRFNLSTHGDAPLPHTPCPNLPSPLDPRIRLQRLSHPDSPGQVGFRLCNRTGGDCFYRAHASGVTAAREWYRLHYLSVLALLPPARQRGHSPRFILSCRYDGQDCQARHLRKAQHPTYGSCYTFDGIWAARRPGVTHRLSLVLRAEQQPHLPLLSPAAGIQLLIHRPDHSPFLGEPGFSVRPGTATTVGIREDEVHRLGSPYSRCAHDSGGVDVQLLFASYTRQACLVSCFQQLMVETCSCGYYLFPLPAGAEYCSSSRHPAWGHCFYRLHRELETHRLACTWRCPRPCRESSYQLSAGTSMWPSSKSTDWVLAVLGERRPSSPRSRRPRSRASKVTILYEELNYRTVDEMPVLSVPQLLSAVGSLCGLWLGSSVLSVLELLELLLDAVALALLVGCRWLHRAQGPQPGVATAESHPVPQAGQVLRACKHGPGGPAASPLVMPSGTRVQASAEDLDQAGPP